MLGGYHTLAVSSPVSSSRYQFCQKRSLSFSHIDVDGSPKMVDVTSKKHTVRTATAKGTIELSSEAMAIFHDPESNPKGSVAAVAKIAAIMAVKRTPDIIPLCHPVNVTNVDISVETKDPFVTITVCVKSEGPTGVEMEALTGVSSGLLTIYDMTKSTGYQHVIKDIRLVNKTGGKSTYKNDF